jgi:cytoskeletal protein CcmA (bactofilin family)
VSTVTHRVPEADSRDSATIGKAVKVVGQIFAKEDLHVEGDVEGTIESTDNKVTVGVSGRVQAAIKAREVVIFGHVQGNVDATEKVDIRCEARLIGDITTARIGIEDGALFKGRIDIQRPQPKPAADGVGLAAAPSPAASSPIASAAVAGPHNH